nr:MULTISPECIES: DUF4194 domain-containing protein [unclassified Pseudomonas]
MNLISTVNSQLNLHNLSLDRFRQIVTRLLAHGVIVRDDDRNEQFLYDDARRVEPLLLDYFDIAGLRLHHDSNACFFRLYAPGARVDGLQDDDLDPVPALKAKLTPDFVAAALALRFIYQEHLNAGSIELNGEAMISLEDLAATMQTQLRRSLPSTAGEKMDLLGQLRRHKILRFNSSFSITDEDAFLAIRPMILGVVTNDALLSALDADGVIEVQATVEEQDSED